MPSSDTSPDDTFVQHLTASQNRLYGYIFSLLSDHHRAEEVLQETNMVLWRKAGEFRVGSDFIPWAFAIARFQVMAHLRDKKRDRLLLDPEVADLVDTDVAEEAGNLAESQAALRICLSKLPKKSRTLIDARYFSGRSIKQLAETMEKTEEAIKVALLRIRRGLRECMQRELARETGT
jgi:RNA polymerase sigma-70 factor, ECF subfamily